MPDWVEYLLRILMAVGLGFIMGSERQLRLKAAGIRTHVVVAAGACLFMLISKYGFGDSNQFDASRVASQVVCGISFIGAGMIMHRQQAVHGLTSAAGVWLTAAIGMAAGAGLYFVALGATVLIILVQFIFHMPLPLFKDRHYSECNITFLSPDEASLEEIKKLFGIDNFTEFKASRNGDDIIYCAVIHTKKQIDAVFIRNVINNNPNIISVQQIDSDK